MVPLDTTAADFPTHLDGGRYTLLEFIGKGGSAVVFRATTPDGECAVKLRTVPERPIQAARFMVESVPMSEIVHPNVVQVLKTGKEGNYLWIAMELFKSGSLRDLVKRAGPPPMDDALRLTEEILDGLQAVHDAGYVHRDIKPQNIFLNEDGTSAIGDFGVARHLNANLWFRTRTGQAIGTMGYRAPEQDNDAKDAGPAADIYGVAATLFFLTIGRRPPLLYASESDPRQLEALPTLLRPIILKATAYNSQNRYSSAKEFRDTIREVRNAFRRADGRPEIEDVSQMSGLRRFLARWIG